MPERPDIFLLTIDALRADHLSCYGYNRETPLFDTLAEETIFFENAFSVSSHTREAMPPLLSGYRPGRFAANGFTQVPESESVAGRLSAGGYSTGGFHSNPYLSRAYGFDAGFDEFYDDLVLGQNKLVALAQQALNKFVFKRGEYYARAPEINRRSLEWLDDTGDSVFLWNHYMDAHGPYHAPERYYADRSLSASAAESLYRRAWKDPGSITEDEQQLLIDSYDDEIRYVDSQIGSFLSSLESRDRLEDALIIVTADHGDAFGEHGYYTHPRHLHDELLHVPLFVSWPDSKRTTVTQPVSTLDVVPTVLESASLSSSSLPGTPLRKKLTEGRDPTDQSAEQAVIASASGEGEDEGTQRFAIRGTTLKVTLERGPDGEILNRAAYDLTEDSDEIRQVPVNQSERTMTLFERLKEHSQSRNSEASHTEHDVEPSAEIESRLEALGYKE